MKRVVLAALLALTGTAYAQSKEKAVVCVYSLSGTTTLGQIRKPVFMDGVEIADVRPERFFIVQWNLEDTAFT